MYEIALLGVFHPAFLIDLMAAQMAGSYSGRAPRQLRLISWQPFRKGPLRGFACIELPIGLRIFDVPIRTGSNGLWAGLAAKPEIDRDGRRKTDINGKPIYAEVLRWRDRELSDRFSQAVVALVRQANPDDLSD